MNNNRLHDEDFEQLGGRISELENLVKDKSKPWYKEAGLWISLIAVIFSIFTGVHEIEHQSSTDIKAKRAEALQNISDLIGTEVQFQSEAKAKGIDPIDYENDALETKYEILLSRMDVINREIPGQLSYDEYSFVADAYTDHGKNYLKSVDYDLNALRVANSWEDSFYSYQKIALAYFAGSEDIRDIAKGDKYFSLSKSIIRMNPWDMKNHKVDGYYLKQYASTFGWMAQKHADIGDTLPIITYCDSAITYLRQIPLDSKWRSQAIRNYNDHVKKINSDLGNHLDTIILP